MTADLVAFLRARLDEDEEAARLAHAVDPAPWYEDVEYDGYTNQRDGHGSGLVRAADNVGLWDREQSCTLSMTAATSVHVARQDPARVLAEVEGTRRIIVEHAPDRGDCRVCAGPEVSSDDADGNRDWSRSALPAPCPTLRLLALPYAAHPDYQPAWVPETEGRA